MSLNERVNNVNQLVHDALTQKNVPAQNDTYENVYSYPIKKAREKFEKNYFTSQLKNIKETYLKPQNLLEWKDLLFIENLNN